MIEVFSGLGTVIGLVFGAAAFKLIKIAQTRHRAALVPKEDPEITNLRIVKAHHKHINELEAEVGMELSIWDDPLLPEELPKPKPAVNYTNEDVKPQDSYHRDLAYTQRLPLATPGASCAVAPAWEPPKPAKPTRIRIQERFPEIVDIAWYMDPDRRETVYTTVRILDPRVPMLALGYDRRPTARPLITLKLNPPLSYDELVMYLEAYLSQLENPDAPLALPGPRDGEKPSLDDLAVALKQQEGLGRADAQKIWNDEFKNPWPPPPHPPPQSDPGKGEWT
jgi:hypothetical protein